MSRTLGAMALLASAAVAAPVPPARPGLSKEQEEVVTAVEADLRDATQSCVRKMERIREMLDTGDVRALREAREAASKEYAARHRVAAERLTRLLGDLGSVASEERLRLSARAGASWHEAGEPERALGFLTPVIRGASAPEVRLAALQDALGCNLRLGRRGEVPALLDLARKELPRLPEADRRRAERWIANLVEFTRAKR